MKIEIKKNSEHIKNIIELKCNIDLDWEIEKIARERSSFQLMNKM
jgi:hypothetical protein